MQIHTLHTNKKNPSKKRCNSVVIRSVSTIFFLSAQIIPATRYYYPSENLPPSGLTCVPKGSTSTGQRSRTTKKAEKRGLIKYLVHGVTLIPAIHPADNTRSIGGGRGGRRWNFLYRFTWVRLCHRPPLERN